MKVIQLMKLEISLNQERISHEHGIQEVIMEAIHLMREEHIRNILDFMMVIQ